MCDEVAHPSPLMDPLHVLGPCWVPGRGPRARRRGSYGPVGVAMPVNEGQLHGVMKTQVRADWGPTGACSLRLETSEASGRSGAPPEATAKGRWLMLGV